MALSRDPHAVSPRARPARPVTLSRRGLLLTAGASAVAAPAVTAWAGPAPGASAARIARGAQSSSGAELPVLTFSGLYAWGYDFLQYRTQVQRLGVTTMRTAQDGMTDEAWTALGQDGYDTHITISGSNRVNFSDEASWIRAYLGRVDGVLARWPFRWVEVWNEPNFGMWAGATNAQKQLAYGNLLVATYRHLRSRWPGVGLVGFGAGGSAAAAPGFIAGVLAAVPDARTSFDVCSLHPYFAPAAPESVRTEPWGTWTLQGQVAAIRRAGVTAPLWFTETGSQIPRAEGGTFAPAPEVTVTPHLQAAYAVRTFLHCMRLGVQRLHHMYVVDTDRYNGGFFTAVGPRPQATAVRFQQALLRRPTSCDVVVDGTDGRHVRRVTSAAGTRFVVWSDDVGVDLKVGRGALVVDLYGRVRKVPASGLLRLEAAPAYVQSSVLDRLVA